MAGTATQTTLEARDRLARHLAGMGDPGKTPARRNILKAFLRLAAEHGVSSVTMRMLGRAVGIQAPSIYAHFPQGRDEIVVASLRWNFHEFGSALLEGVASAVTPREHWDAIVRVHLVRQLQLPESNLWDLLVATDRMAGTLPPQGRAEANQLMELHESILEAAAREMGVRHPRPLVGIVVTLLEGATRWNGWDGDESHLPALAERAVQLAGGLLEQAITTDVLVPGPVVSRQRGITSAH
ncbi:TetR/AcrR family transcriptional regulator [Kineococcus aurantiacus]|uniref:AcrR family transcriptional regulator n=1 Tax=Kineococcus aurantiacus TaxID=37633 RepID=A0A7Y9DQU9_9ACTN|nr:TetR/AcrR family transcriptional regulator [Kineococcus aurantiacus]NYD25152.1 AcrR family transcriptional regulator [Kineococcus aurantiacus]